MSVISDAFLLLTANLPRLSIIAIPGLDGHAYGSWRGKGNLGRMWLRHFLSKDLPSCRTMIYGYNSKLSSYGIDTILDYGRQLLEELKKVRNTEEVSAVTKCPHQRKHEADGCDAPAETAAALLYCAQLWWSYTCSRKSSAVTNICPRLSSSKEPCQGGSGKRQRSSNDSNPLQSYIRHASVWDSA